MCIPCFLLLFIFYVIIGMVAGTIYISKLIADIKAEKKQSNRNMVLYTLHDIEYDKTNSNKKSNSNVNTCLFTSLGLTRADLAYKSFKPNCYLEFKGKQYMVDINGNILPLNLD